MTKREAINLGIETINQMYQAGVFAGYEVTQEEANILAAIAALMHKANSKA